MSSDEHTTTPEIEAEPPEIDYTYMERAADAAQRAEVFESPDVRKAIAAAVQAERAANAEAVCLLCFRAAHGRDPADPPGERWARVSPAVATEHGWRHTTAHSHSEREMPCCAAAIWADGERRDAGENDGR